MSKVQKAQSRINKAISVFHKSLRDLTEAKKEIEVGIKNTEKQINALQKEKDQLFNLSVSSEKMIDKINDFLKKKKKIKYVKKVV